VIHGDKRTVRREWRIPSRYNREWISTRYSQPWIVKSPGRHIQGKLRAPGRCVGRIKERFAVREVISKRIRRTNRSPAISLRIPRQSNPRRDVPPSFVHAGVSGEPGVTGIVQSGRSIFVGGTVNAIDKPVVIEVIDLT